jgi:predicted  nucleic acid-binding Zn-ribbon protein
MQSSPDKLIEAFNSLLTVLDNEAKKFQSSVAAQKTNEVDAREGQVQQINAQIENKNKEIQSLMEQRDGIATDIVTAKKKLGAISASFEGAVASLQSEVGDSLQKLRIYFPATSAAAKK